MSGINQREREAVARYMRRHVIPRVGPMHEVMASIECDGCGFVVRRVMDPDGPLPNWARQPDGTHLCPNCQ